MTDTLATMPSADFTATLLAYLLTLAVYAISLVVYCSATPHSELKLMRAGNAAAALSFSVTALAFALVLAAAVHNTHSPVEIVLWGTNALLFQLITYYIATRIFTGTSKAIEEGAVLRTLPLAALQLATALLNAAVFAG